MRSPDEMRADAERAQALAEKATPGPWRQAHQRGYCIDYIVTDHAAFQTKPHGNYVGETGVGTGQPRQNFVEDVAFIAAARTAVPALASDVLSLLAERDAAYNKGKCDGLLKMAQEAVDEANKAEIDWMAATDSLLRMSFYSRMKTYQSIALICHSRAYAVDPEDQSE